MKFILVIARQHLFPGLSPQGVIPSDDLELGPLTQHAFFAERDFMENCSHYKQIIPYIALIKDGQVLCYQRQSKHSNRLHTCSIVSFLSCVSMPFVLIACTESGIERPSKPVI